MQDDVKKCVDARLNFFDEYYTVPQSIQGEVDSFIKQMTVLGEGCANATAFEEKFVSTGLSDKFNTILPKCTPKTVRMTKEQKQQSRKYAKEILHENKEELIASTVKNVADMAVTKAKGELINANRDRMIENNTMDDYSRAHNYVTSAEEVVRFFKKKFKKN